MKKILLLLLIPYSIYALVTDTPTTSGKWSALTWSAGIKPGNTELFCNKSNIKDTCDRDTTLGGLILNRKTGGAEIFAGRTIHILNDWLDTTGGAISYPNSLLFDNATKANFYCGYNWNQFTAVHCTVFVNTPKLTAQISAGTTTNYTFASLRIGEGDTLVLSPPAISDNSINITGIKSLVMNNGKFTYISASKPLNFWSANNLKYRPLVLTGSPIIDGTGKITFTFGGNNNYDTISAITYAGTGIIEFINIFSYSGGNFVLAGNQIYSGGMTVAALSSAIFDCKTYSITFNGSINNTFTTGGTQVYYDIIQSGTNKMTQVGNLLCKNNFSILSGKWLMPNGGIDSCKDFYLTTSDSVIGTGNLLKIGRHHTATGSGVVLNNSAIEYVGSATNHNLTAGNNRMSVLRILNNGSLTLLSRAWCNELNAMAGKLFLNEYSLVIDSSLSIGDSIYTDINDSIINNGSVTIGATAKPNLRGILSMNGNTAATITGGGNSKSLGRVFLNKGSGTTVTMNGVTKFTTLNVMTGKLAMSSATDTIYCDTLNWVSTDASTIQSIIIVSSKIIIANGANITYSGIGKIVSTACNEATLNGNPIFIRYPTIGPISYAGSPWIDTIGRLSTHSITIGGCSIKKDSIIAITALPVGYSYSKVTGLISWDGTGSQQTAGNYTIRAYANAKADSASIVVNIAIAPAMRIWSSTGSTDANDGNNYTPTGPILSTDALLLNSTSAQNWILTSNLTCINVNVTSAYTGAISIPYTLTTIGSQLFNGTFSDTLRISDTCKITQNGKFRIGTGVWAKCTGATLKLLGDRTHPDTIDLVQGANPGYGTFGNWFVEARNTFKNIVVAQDTGSKCYVVSGMKLCYHSFNVGCGQVIGATGNVNVWGIDPDTADFLFIGYPINKRKIFSSLSTFRAFTVFNVSFPSITKFNWPKVDTGGSTLVQTNKYDTIVLTDTMQSFQFYSGMIPLPCKFTVLCRNNYNNFNGLLMYSNGVTDTMEVHFGHSLSDVGYIGNHGNTSPTVPTGSFMLYLDTATILYRHKWGRVYWGNTPMWWVADRSTVCFQPNGDVSVNDSIWSFNMPFYNVKCSTNATQPVVVVDSMTVNNWLNVKAGKFKAISSIRVNGDFVDSTSDSTILSSMYLGGNAYFSSQTKLKWNTGAIIYAVGTKKQVIYTNGQSMTNKIIVTKGSKLTVR